MLRLHHAAPAQMHLADRDATRSRFQHRRWVGRIRRRHLQPGEAADGRGLADADAADEGHLMLALEQQACDGAQLLYIRG